MFVNDKNHTVSSNLRIIRKSCGMTQDELALQVQATRQTIIAIEKGNYVPSVLLALRLATVLNKKVEDIFHYEKV